MKQEELAKDYSEKLLADLKTIVENAYKEGFEAGVKSVKIVEPGQLVLPNAECEPTELCPYVRKEEYKDLGLPSGTLWAFSGSGIFSEAVKWNLPTQEQWEELAKYCRLVACEPSSYPNYGYVSSPKYEIHCVNGGYIFLYSEELLYWIKQGTEFEKNKYALNLKSLFNNKPFSISKEKKFAGEILDVALVIKK